MKPFFAALSVVALGCSSPDFDVASIEGTQTESDAAEQDASSVDSNIIVEETAIDSGASEEDTSSPEADSGPLVVDTGSPVDSAATSKDTGSVVDSVVTSGCVSPAACPSGTECQVASCTSGMCGLANKPTTATCSTGKCNGMGKCVQCLVGSDCATGNCDAAGHCVECLTASTCPSPAVECKTATCIGGKCGIGPKAAGTFCHGFDDQCDGLGNCVDCVNSGGCGECCVCTANACTPA